MKLPHVDTDPDTTVRRLLVLTQHVINNCGPFSLLLSNYYIDAGTGQNRENSFNQLKLKTSEPRLKYQLCQVFGTSKNLGSKTQTNKKHKYKD